MAHDHAAAYAHANDGPGMRRRLGAVLAVTAALGIAEAIGGWRSGSLALWADAGHMASDCAALGLALFAAWVADRPAPARQTFGAQRAEILAAVANAVLLAVVMISVIHAAVGRLRAPAPPDAGPMFWLGALGLAAVTVSSAAFLSVPELQDTSITISRAGSSLIQLVACFMLFFLR